MQAPPAARRSRKAWQVVAHRPNPVRPNDARAGGNGGHDGPGGSGGGIFVQQGGGLIIEGGTLSQGTVNGGAFTASTRPPGASARSDPLTSITT
jgi:hypothetical protein